MTLTIRPPGKGDTEKLIRCIAEARGLDYYKKEYYEPGYLTENNEIFAAYDENGKMAGFTGISRGRFDTERNTLSLLNIRTAYTNNGVATRLLVHSVQAMRERGVKAVKGNIVTRHTAIQHVLENLGLVPTGFLPGARDGKNSLPHVNEKCTLTAHTLPVAITDAGTIFVHKRIIGLAEAVYKSLHVPVTIMQEGKWDTQNILQYEYDNHDEVLFIQTENCAATINDEISILINKYKTSPRFTAIILLNLQHPSAVEGYAALVDSGWLFYGFDSLGKYENAVLYQGETALNEMSLTERTNALYEQLHF